MKYHVAYFRAFSLKTVVAVRTTCS